MKIRILGSGCASCRTLTARATEAAATAGIAAEVMEIHDVAEIAAWGVMRTPALVVDDRVLVTGRVPSVAELAELIAAA